MVTRRRLLGGGAALLATAAGRPPAPVRLGWQPALAADATVPVAHAAGALDGVTLVPADGSHSLPALLRAGAVDAAVTPALPLLLALNEELDAKLTCGLAGGGLRLLAARGARLRHIEDLKGKTIGVGRLDGSAKLFFSIMMRRKGIDPFREVTWVELAPAAQADALRERHVDAVAAPDPLAFIFREQLRLTEIATDISGSYRDRTAVVLACAGSLLANRPEAATALTAALLGAATAIARDPVRAATDAAILAPALSRDEFVRMLRAEAPDQHPTGAALVEDVAAYADELRLLGLFPYALNSGRWARGVCRIVT